ncbi:hypothetical protein IEQ34_007748 [Dendrobium chrysotoxum]|uniref:HNH homing endonuclease n=1 Tax=Dendrobium chrysotoxum TaxID=161865 RepID=A0AAV7H295_DENCH|nr:hypothetical protein IEQ34_007748 [Dendrobium chrysotoxum]
MKKQRLLHKIGAAQRSQNKKRPLKIQNCEPQSKRGSQKSKPATQKNSKIARAEKEDENPDRTQEKRPFYVFRKAIKTPGCPETIQGVHINGPHHCPWQQRHPKSSCDIWENDEGQDKSKWDNMLAPLAYENFASRILVQLEWTQMQ